jgi:hypothetical protein
MPEWAPRNYTVNHAVLVLAFTTDNFAHVAYPSGIRPEAWAKDLRLLLKRDRCEFNSWPSWPR